MVAPSFFSLVAVFSLATCALGKPISWKSSFDKRHSKALPAPVSFNNYGGKSSLSNFDNFNGVSNFDGSQNEQIFVEQSEKVVCTQIDVEIIQQKLVVIREMVKRILVEQICEVEVQTVVLEQFSSSIDSFGKDIRHKSSRQIGYDSNIASLSSHLYNSDGSQSNHNLGFSGSQVGNHSVSVSGSNWNDSSSPASVGAIYQSSKSAKEDAQSKNGTISSSSSTSSTSSSSTTSSSSSKASSSTSSFKSSSTSSSSAAATTTAKAY